MKTMRFSGMLFMAACAISMINLGCPNDEDSPEPDPQIEFDTIADIDGNLYQTVVIGDQTWTAENLRVTRLNDGTPIPLRDYDHWWPSETPQMAMLADDSSNVATKGLLYNWYVVATGKLAPPGWHVASDADWQQLIEYAGGYQVAGGKLKQVDTTLWAAPNIDATNAFGFSAIPGYWRTAAGHTIISSGELFFDDMYAHFWTSTAQEPFALAYALQYDHGAITDPQADHYHTKQYAMSVRLVKD